MANKPDQLDIVILPDGTIRTETGPVSGPNHSNAEAFLKFIQELSGGKTTRTRRGHKHGHVHHHHDEEESH